MDLRMDFGAQLDKRDADIHRLTEDVVRQRDEIRGKDEAIKALSMTLLEKGKDNQKLAEMVLEIKNHQLETQVLGQKFLVTRPGIVKNEDLIFRFTHDKSREEDYFLEICDSKGKPLRAIAVCDIEGIEPCQGTRFLL
jgi:predicted RNase H-like nuclease (RuvC/YqgF family)